MSESIDRNSLLSAKQAAEEIGISYSRLVFWRSKRIGPPYFRRVGRVLYDRRDIESWLLQQRVGK